MSAPGPPVGLTVWPPARRGLAAAAIAAAAITGVLAWALHDHGLVTLLGFVHLAAACWAVQDGRAVPTQVGSGVALTWSLLAGAHGTVPGVVPVLLGVIAASELLGSSHRLGTVLARDVVGELRRVGTALVVASGASVAVLGVGALAGPSGMVATAAGGVGCGVLALAVRARPSDR